MLFSIVIVESAATMTLPSSNLLETYHYMTDHLEHDSIIIPLRVISSLLSGANARFLTSMAAPSFPYLRADIPTLSVITTTPTHLEKRIDLQHRSLFHDPESPRSFCHQITNPYPQPSLQSLTENASSRPLDTL